MQERAGPKVTVNLGPRAEHGNFVNGFDGALGLALRITKR